MSDQIPAPQLPDPLDRRNNTGVQWVRDALTDQSQKIDTLTDKVDALHGTMTKSVPDGDFKTHHDTHAMLARQKEASDERKKFWRSFRDDIMKKGLTAAVVFIAALFALGSQAKFKEWVNAAVSVAPVEIKK
jgi:hypothetical protein